MNLPPPPDRWTIENAADGDGETANAAEIEAVVEVPDDLTSQSRHSLLLSGSPLSGKTVDST